MVAQDHVYQQIAEVGGEVRDPTQLFLDHAYPNHDMTDELALGCISNAPCKRELADFAQIVQDYAGQKKIEIYVRIMSGGETRQMAHRKHVLDQAADPIVMHGLSRWRGPERRGNQFIPKDRFQQRLEMRVGHSGDPALELAE